MIDLSQVPVGLTLRSADCQIVMNALVEYEGTSAENRRLPVILEHLRVQSEAAMRLHSEEGVPAPRGELGRRLEERRAAQVLKFPGGEAA